MKLLYHISDAPSKKGIGNKALSLRKLQSLKLRIPETWIIPSGVVEELTDPEAPIWNNLQKEVDKTLDPSAEYALRSSGELEDSAEHSFAGQFSTFLGLRGSDALMDGIRKIRDSAEKTLEEPYNKKTSSKSDLPGMAVIIQEMVQARWSGVSFSVNPITGRNEYVIEAVEGAGSLLVEDGINPHRWIWHQGTWENEGPEDSLLKDKLGELIRAMPLLRKHFKGEVDVEWAVDGKDFWFLQCRPVTVREFPTIYSNHISREVLPGMIKPLVWSVNIPLVNGAWIRLLEGLLGKLNIGPEQLSASFYYRAYFNMGTLGELFSRMGLPRDSLESLMGRKDPSGKSSFKPGMKTIKYLPGILGFMISNLFLRRKFLKRFQQLKEATDELALSLQKAEAGDYFTFYKRIRDLASEVAYYNIIIPLAMQISNRMLQRKLKKRDIPFEKINFAPDYPELLAYDPGQHIPGLKARWLEIPEANRKGIKRYADFSGDPGNAPLREFRKGFEELLERFGHVSESGNDFSYTPWREDPDFLFNQITAGDQEGPGSTPAASGQESAVSGKTAGIPAGAYRRAGRYRLYREMISSEYTRSYGLFRLLFLKTGSNLVQKGCLKEAEDVFYLTLEEHDRALKGIPEQDIPSLQNKIAEVKGEMEKYRDVTLPSVIFGEIPPPLPVEDASVLEGIPTSPGIYEGEIVVVKGYDDFDKKVEGKILVIPFSDVGWTPLLIKAGAIVSESGGMLSHASIIARELKIPAISSADNACTLKEGAHALVDGYAGKLTIQNSNHG